MKNVIDSDIALENSYFLNKKRNNSLGFLQKFGDRNYTFSWDASDVHNSHGELVTHASQLNIQHEGVWVEMIQDHICKLSFLKPYICFQ
jgi:hypothetical protein